MRAQKPGTRGNKIVVIIGVSLEIQAISDADQLSFEAGLPPDELEYIYSLAKGILVSWIARHPCFPIPKRLKSCAQLVRRQ